MEERGLKLEALEKALFRARRKKKKERQRQGVEHKKSARTAHQQARRGFGLRARCLILQRGEPWEYKNGASLSG